MASLWVFRIGLNNRIIGDSRGEVEVLRILVAIGYHCGLQLLLGIGIYHSSVLLWIRRKLIGIVLYCFYWTFLYGV